MIIDRTALWLKIREQIAYDRELIGDWDIQLPRIIVYGRGISFECED